MAGPGHPGPHQIVTDRDIQKFHHLYVDNGKPIREVAELTGYSQHTVERYLHKLGVMRTYEQARQLRKAMS